MKAIAAFCLLVVTIFAVPTDSLAAEGRGVRQWIVCLQCSPDIDESLHIARSSSAAAIVLQLNVYDANGIFLGSAIFPDPAGTFLAQQVPFLTTQVLAQAALPAGLYAGVLFNASSGTQIFYEQLGINAQGIAGILTGRGDGYNYAGTTLALTLYPENGTGLLNFFICNNPANNMATFLGIPGPAPGAQGIAQLITAAGDLSIANFPAQNLFQRSVTQLNPGGAAGGSLILGAPGGTLIECVKTIRIQDFGIVAGYTY
jgi:hypothetical protein